MQGGLGPPQGLDGSNPFPVDGRHRVEPVKHFLYHEAHEEKKLVVPFASFVA